MTTAIAIPLSEAAMATARMSKQMRLDLGPPALTIRDVDPDAIDLALKLFIDDLNEAELCQAEILKICIALRGPGRCNDPNDPIWKQACAPRPDGTRHRRRSARDGDMARHLPRHAPSKVEAGWPVLRRVRGPAGWCGIVLIRRRAVAPEGEVARIRDAAPEHLQGPLARILHAQRAERAEGSRRPEGAGERI